MKLLSLLVSGLLLGASVWSAQAAGHQADTSPVLSTNRISAAELPIPESVFTIPPTPRQGRNPFFPNSQAAVPVVKATPTNVLDASVLVLNGITPRPKPMAMINGRSFEVGEAGDVKLANGVRIPVQCLEIYDDRVIIKAGGQRRELQWRSKY